MSWVSSSGLRSWMIQRLSAIYLAVFFPVALIALAVHPPGSYEQWHALMVNPVVNVATGLFFLCLLLHAWVGIRDVILDYVKPFSIRLTVLVMIGFAWLAMGLWMLRSLLMLAA